MEEKTGEKIVPMRKGDNVAPNGTMYVQAVQTKKPSSPMVRGIRQSLIWFNIFTATICAFISLLNIWTDDSLSDIMGKVWATFFVLGFFSLVIALIAPLLDKE